MNLNELKKDILFIYLFIQHSIIPPYTVPLNVPKNSAENL